jgi:hypothetical protein
MLLAGVRNPVHSTRPAPKLQRDEAEAVDRLRSALRRRDALLKDAERFERERMGLKLQGARYSLNRLYREIPKLRDELDALLRAGEEG